eukprot:COSAG06_NODE_3184_length_5718_cov_20.414842_5_plen_71_part_00
MAENQEERERKPTGDGGAKHHRMADLTTIRIRHLMNVTVQLMNSTELQHYNRSLLTRSVADRPKMTAAAL